MKPEEKEYLNYEEYPDGHIINESDLFVPLSTRTITLSDTSSNYFSFPVLDEELKVRDERICSLEKTLEEAKRILRDNGLWNDSDSDCDQKIDDDDYLE